MNYVPELGNVALQQRYSSFVLLPLCLLNHYLFTQVACLQHRPAAVAGVFPVFGSSQCVCVNYVRQARADQDSIQTSGGLYAIKPDGCNDNFPFFLFVLQIIQGRGSALHRSPSQTPSDHAWVRPLKTHRT